MVTVDVPAGRSLAMALVYPNRQVVDTIHAVQLDAVLAIYDDVESAVRSSNRLPTACWNGPTTLYALRLPVN